MSGGDSTVTLDGRTVTLREMRPSDIFDLMEVVGDTSPGAMTLASTVFAVAAIDGVPEPPFKTRAEMKALANRLGFPMLAAIRGKLFPLLDETGGAETPEPKNEIAAIAKN